MLSEMRDHERLWIFSRLFRRIAFQIGRFRIFRWHRSGGFSMCVCHLLWGAKFWRKLWAECLVLSAHHSNCRCPTSVDPNHWAWCVAASSRTAKRHHIQFTVFSTFLLPGSIRQVRNTGFDRKLKWFQHTRKEHVTLTCEEAHGDNQRHARQRQDEQKTSLPVIIPGWSLLIKLIGRIMFGFLSFTTTSNLFLRGRWRRCLYQINQRDFAQSCAETQPAKKSIIWSWIKTTTYVYIFFLLRLSDLTNAQWPATAPHTQDKAMCTFFFLFKKNSWMQHVTSSSSSAVPECEVRCTQNDKNIELCIWFDAKFIVFNNEKTLPIGCPTRTCKATMKQQRWVLFSCGMQSDCMTQNEVVKQSTDVAAGSSQTLNVILHYTGFSATDYASVSAFPHFLSISLRFCSFGVGFLSFPGFTKHYYAVSTSCKRRSWQPRSVAHQKFMSSLICAEITQQKTRHLQRDTSLSE